MNAVSPFKPLTIGDVADILGVTVRTVENHIDEQGLPRPAKIGKIRYWHPDIFYAWLDGVLRKGDATPADAEPRQATESGGARQARGAVLVDALPRQKPLRGTAKLSAVERARARDGALLMELEGG